LVSPAGVLESEAAWAGKDILGRRVVGLKSPGDDNGVLFEVR
jgi:hypothetical protein